MGAAAGFVWGFLKKPDPVAEELRRQEREARANGGFVYNHNAVIAAVGGAMMMGR